MWLPVSGVKRPNAAACDKFHSKVGSGSLALLIDTFSDRGSKRIRSMILPLQSIINPLGLIGGLKLVVANSGIGQFILTVQGLVTDALLVLAVLAIRKRFRPR